QPLDAHSWRPVQPCALSSTRASMKPAQRVPVTASDHAYDRPVEHQGREPREIAHCRNFANGSVKNILTCRLGGPKAAQLGAKPYLPYPGSTNFLIGDQPCRK